MAYLPNAEFKIIKGSGHLIPIDERMRLAKEIAGFTTRLAVIQEVNGKVLSE